MELDGNPPKARRVVPTCWVWQRWGVLAAVGLIVVASACDAAQEADTPEAAGSSALGEPDTPVAAGSSLPLGSDGGERITICHRTNGSNEYVEITISENAIDAHLNHPWGPDIIPAPPEGCPTESTEPPIETTEPPIETTEPPIETTEPPIETSPGTIPPGGLTPPPPTGSVPDSALDSGVSPGGAEQGGGGAGAGELPPTGDETPALLVLALGALLLGFGAVRLSRR